MEKISVIVPIYNTKNELDRCLSSICHQTYQNLEIICVDDGSTDGSEVILDRFADQDNRILAIHQSNAGESNARNTGLRKATGDYIAFCDCDDWIENDMYQVMIDAMLSIDADLVATGWLKEERNESGFRTEEIKNDLPVTTGIIDNRQLLEYLYKRDSYRGFAYMWNKLYKRSILFDSQGDLLLFDENLRLGGDVVYLAEAALHVKKAKYIDRAFYHYNQRSLSGCHTRDVGKLRDWISAYEYVIRRFEEKKVEEQTIRYVKRFLAYHSSNAARIAYEQKETKALKEFQSLMKQYEKEYISLNAAYPERLELYRQILNYN